MNRWRFSLYGYGFSLVRVLQLLRSPAPLIDGYDYHHERSKSPAWQCSYHGGSQKLQGEETMLWYPKTHCLSR
jgi:hypothetical protein